MKVLVFEYITGGGLNDALLPDALAREGQMMRDALVSDLCEINGIEVLLFRDIRTPFPSDKIASPNKLSIITIKARDNYRAIWLEALKKVDAVWPVAPETNQILADLCQDVEVANKVLLTSGSTAVVLTGDKLKTYQVLSRYDVKMAQTVAMSQFCYTTEHTWVLKPVDGVGCDHAQVIQSIEDYQQVQKKCSVPEEWIVQPFVKGVSMSLSVLMRDGQAILLSCNQQKIIIKSGRFELIGCRVNVEPENRKELALLLQTLTKQIPGLWGYVGIDYIDSETGPSLLEINPRLTTSYVGIRKALGVNVAGLVLQLMRGLPELLPTCNEVVDITLNEPFAMDVHE